MRPERNVGVRRILGGKVSGEVVEAAVVRFADESDLAEQLFCGLGIWRGSVDIAEAVDTLEDC